MSARRHVMPARRRTAAVGDQPVHRFAGRTIRRRLHDVWTELGEACRARGDRDSVHRLRVATRRASAAIDAFAALVPPGRRRWFDRRLRTLRRAAGDARDLDVLAARIADDAPSPAASAGRRRLREMLARQRPEARRPVVEARDRLVDDGWTVHIDRLVDRLGHGSDHATVRQFSRKRMKREIRRFFERADRHGRRRAELHRLRIDGKRLRYAFEVFASALDPGGRSRCERTLESFQKRLGRYTDHESAAARFGRWSAGPALDDDRRLLEAMRGAECAAAKRARGEFVKWWTPSRRRSLRKRCLAALRKESA